MQRRRRRFERERERGMSDVFFGIASSTDTSTFLSLSLYIRSQAAYYCARMTGTGKTQNAGRKNKDAQQQKYTYHHIIIPRISNLATERQRVRTYITHVLYVREGWRRVNNMPRHPRSHKFHVDVSLSLPHDNRSLLPRQATVFERNSMGASTRQVSMGAYVCM